MTYLAVDICKKCRQLWARDKDLSPGLCPECGETNQDIYGYYVNMRRAKLPEYFTEGKTLEPVFVCSNCGSIFHKGIDWEEGYITNCPRCNQRNVVEAKTDLWYINNAGK